MAQMRLVKNWYSRQPIVAQQRSNRIANTSKQRTCMWKAGGAQNRTLPSGGLVLFCCTPADEDRKSSRPELPDPELGPDVLLLAEFWPALVAWLCTLWGMLGCCSESELATCTTRSVILATATHVLSCRPRLRAMYMSSVHMACGSKCLLLTAKVRSDASSAPFRSSCGCLFGVCVCVYIYIYIYICMYIYVYICIYI
jgi:hypothetical protein